MVGDCMVQLPHKLGIVGAGCNVEECRSILRSRPQAAPLQGLLQRLAARWQCVDATANQLKLITQHNFNRHRRSRRLYQPKQNAITVNQVGCIDSRNALNVEGGIHSQIRTVGPRPHTGNVGLGVCISTAAAALLPQGRQCSGANY